MTLDREGPAAREDMDPAAFRRYGHEVVDWIASYLENIDHYPVLSQAHPGEIAAQLPAQHPEAPEAMERILADFETVIVPGITHWNHPSFLSPTSASVARRRACWASCWPRRST